MAMSGVDRVGGSSKPDQMYRLALSPSRWEFPKIGDPNIAPNLVGSLLQGPQDKVPLIFGKSQISNQGER